MIINYCLFILAVTVFYGLMDGKHIDSYQAVIRTLKCEAEKCGINFRPSYIMSHFEGCLIKAIKKEVNLFKFLFYVITHLFLFESL